jgi:hypothetical protein
MPRSTLPRLSNEQQTWLMVGMACVTCFTLGYSLACRTSLLAMATQQQIALEEAKCRTHQQETRKFRAQSQVYPAKAHAVAGAVVDGLSG